MTEPVDSTLIKQSEFGFTNDEVAARFSSLAHPPKIDSSREVIQDYQTKLNSSYELFVSFADDETYKQQVFGLLGKLLEPDAAYESSYYALRFILDHKESTIRALENDDLRKNFLGNLMNTAYRNPLVRGDEEDMPGLNVRSETASFVTPLLLKELTSSLTPGDISREWSKIGAEANTEELIKLFDDISLQLSAETADSVIIAKIISVQLGNIAEDADKLYAFLEKFNLPPKQIFSAWNFSHEENFRRLINRKVPNQIWRINFERLLEIEFKRPGIAQFLHKQYGISDFARYPAETLIDQYDARYDTSSPYGVVLFPRDDHNGAFYDTGYLDNLQTDLKKAGYRIRIFECESQRDLRSAIFSARRQFGQIHFALIGGHGTKSSISFGNSFDEKHKLTTEDLLRPNMPVVTRAFTQHPTIILKSCSTGVEGGIAQQMSALGANLLAPDQETNIKSLRFRVDEGKEIFDVTYWDKTPTIAYAGGKKIN